MSAASAIGLHDGLRLKLPLSIIKYMIDAEPEATTALGEKGLLPLTIACDIGCEAEVIELVCRAMISELTRRGEATAFELAVLLSSEGTTAEKLTTVLQQSEEGATTQRIPTTFFKSDEAGTLLHLAIELRRPVSIMHCVLKKDPSALTLTDTAKRLPLDVATESDYSPQVIETIVRFLLEERPQSLSSSNEELEPTSSAGAHDSEGSEEPECPLQGVTLEVIRAIMADARVSETTTTDKVCHTILKPATVPEGWVESLEAAGLERWSRRHALHHDLYRSGDWRGVN